MSTPPRPARFGFDAAPAGVAVGFVTFWQDRALLNGGRARLQLVHTNAASREGSIRASWNWAHARPGSNTIPHYQVDRNGAAQKMLPTNRRGIANATRSDAPGYNVHGNVRNWSLGYETADTGTIADPSISAFTDAQAETLAAILAFESITAAPEHDRAGIPLGYPGTWYAAGTACHTEPFGYPFWTVAEGKTCPGSKKKRQVRDLILPRARVIADAWLGVTAPPPQPAPPGGDAGKLLAHGWYYVRAGDSPWKVAALVLGDGRRHPELTARDANAGTWQPGQFIEIPDTPTIVLTVAAGDSPWRILERLFPNVDPRARLPGFYTFNGGEGRVLKPGDVVSVPVFWRPR